MFRQVSLDRLSSPEQLDQYLRITSLRSWMILGGLLTLLAGCGLWGFEGYIESTSTGTGVIVRQGGLLNIVAQGSGVVLDIKVKPGSQVFANEVLATIAQPALAQQLQLLERARLEAQNNQTQSFRLDNDSSRLKTEAIQRQHANLETHIDELRRREKLINDQILVEAQLYAQGLVTNQEVLDMKQKAVGVNEEIASAEAQLKELDAEKYAVAAQPEQQDMPLLTRVSELDRQIADARQKLKLAQQVISPYDGEVLEVQASSGSTVAEGQAIVSIQPRQQSLELVAYIPSLLAKNVRTDMEAKISPSNVKREEYGFIRGNVRFVADYPSTQAAMMRNFENEAFIRSLMESGPVTEVHISLQRDQTTRSGFRWSTSKGPDVPITGGTICQVDIVTKRERPVSLALPYLKSVAGF